MHMSDSENEDPASASKENNPSLSPSPVHTAPPTLSPRKNAFGKRPLSVLSIAYPEESDSDMMLVDSDSDGENNNPTTGPPNQNAANIIANLPPPNPFANPFSARVRPPISQHRAKTPRLAPPRLREDVLIYEDVPDRTLTDSSRRFGGDSKENGRALKELRELSPSNLHPAPANLMQASPAHEVPALLTESMTQASAAKVMKKKVGAGGAKKGMKVKPRIGLRRL